MEANETQTPYLDARRSWDERYGGLIIQARNWRAAFFLMAAVAILSSAGNLVQLGRQKFRTFIVATDSVGRVFAAGVADDVPVVNDRMKRAALDQWVTTTWTVTTDEMAQRRQVKAVFAMVGRSSPAATWLAEYFNPALGGTTPFERAKTRTVEVQMDSILPTSDQTYEVRWTGIARDLQGAVIEKTPMLASITILVDPPKDADQALINPFGIYITRVSLSQVRS